MNAHSHHAPGLEYGRKNFGHGDDDAVTRELKRIMGEAKTAVVGLKSASDEHGARLTDIEQKMARRSGPGGPAVEPSPGEALVESDDFKALAKSTSQRGKAVVQVKAVTTMTSATGSSGALIAPDYRPDAVMLPQRRMTIRALLAPGQTAGSAVQYPRQTVRNLNAANVADTLLKPQSEIDFELVTAPVQTTAHFMVASRQVMDDAPQLKSLVDVEMRYGLDLVEEAGFLYGDGTGVNFLGITGQAQAYSAPPARPPPASPASTSSPWPCSSPSWRCCPRPASSCIPPTGAPSSSRRTAWAATSWATPSGRTRPRSGASRSCQRWRCSPASSWSGPSATARRSSTGWRPRC